MRTYYMLVTICTFCNGVIDNLCLTSYCSHLLFPLAYNLTYNLVVFGVYN